MSEKIPKLMTLKRFAEKHSDAWTLTALRWLRFHDETNGFKGAFVKVGGRVLVDEERFFEAVERMNERPARVGGRFG